MTQKELLEKIEEYIQSLNDDEDAEWWCTNHKVGQVVLYSFLHWLLPGNKDLPSVDEYLTFE